MPGSNRAQARRSKADQLISDARKPYMLHAIQVMNRRRSDGHSYLFEDEDGHALFVAMCSLGLRKAKWDDVAPWFKLMPKPEREAFELRIARFKPTLRAIAVAARLTRADREKYGRETRLVGNETKRPMQALLQLPVIDADLDAERRDARNAARRKRREVKAAADAAKDADPRVQRRRQRDRAYREAKRRAEGSNAREAYLTGSIEAARPWEAFGIKRRAWERRGKPVPTTTQVRRQQCTTQVRRQRASPKPLNHQVLVATADGPKPKKERGSTTMTDILRGKATGLGNEEFVSAPRPLSPSQPLEVFMDDRDNAPTDLMEWLSALQQDKWREALPELRRQMARLERQVVLASLTLSQTLHIQAEMMSLRQVLAGMEEAVTMPRWTNGALR